ncbi:metal-sensing transcriptional repressor [Streptomyces bobili]|uniref:metal-sensing transcriptional repressor n=1 Tax=Streptomyces bobili TaxID=67280 RepID=UPI0033AD324F
MDVLAQVSATTEPLRSFAQMMTADHLQSCVADTITQGGDQGPGHDRRSVPGDRLHGPLLNGRALRRAAAGQGRPAPPGTAVTSQELLRSHTAPSLS